MGILLDRHIKRFVVAFLALLILAFIGIKLSEASIERNVRFIPDYEQIEQTELEAILLKESLTNDDYKTLFYQTGLGPVAIDELMSDPHFNVDTIINFQKNFFRETPYEAISIGFTTSHYFTDTNGSIIYGFDLAPYHTADVVITDTSYTVGWRHGHAGLITDANAGETLEASTLGENSKYRTVNSWRQRPTFVLLRLKDASIEEREAIAGFAKEHMHGVPYKLTIGLFNAKNPSPEKIKGTHCSHLVWYPFMQHGVDVDSDGFWLVTPNDMMFSEHFEVIQIYGFHPDLFWEDR